jgi:simple sugar transport system permease protein
MHSLLTRFKRSSEAYLTAVILLFVVILGVLTPDFLTLNNWVDLIESYSVTAILAIGLFVVLVTGGIDISFAATASVAQYVAAYCATRMNLPPPVVLLVGATVGTLLGCFNALLIDRLRATAIIITISTMSVYFALLMYFTSGKSIYGLPAWWSDSMVLFEWSTGLDETVRLTLPIVVMLVVAVVTAFIMNRTSLGRQLYAMGGNPEAARRVGVSISSMQWFAYSYLGLLAGIAGLLQAHRVGESVPNAMIGSELNVIAAAVLGGASLMGGIGSVSGVVLGILLLAILRNGLNLLGVSPYFFQIVIGVILLASTGITGLSQRRRRVAEQL